MAAIRETFEESGILLARNKGPGRLVELNQTEREEGRRKVHGGEVEFARWLAGKGAQADIGEFIPRLASFMTVAEIALMTYR